MYNKLVILSGIQTLFLLRLYWNYSATVESAIISTENLFDQYEALGLKTIEIVVLNISIN